MHISLFFSPFLSFLPSVEDVLYHEGKVDLCVYGGCKDVVFSWGRGGMGLPLCVCVCVVFFFLNLCLELVNAITLRALLLPHSSVDFLFFVSLCACFSAASHVTHHGLYQ